MKNKILKGGVCWLSFVLIFNFQSALAAGKIEAEKNNNKSGESALIADINFRSQTLGEQEDHKLNIFFSLENNLSQSEAGIRYGVQLREDETVLDEKVYADDVLFVEGNSSVQKMISYEAPRYLFGIFEVWLVAKNESGLLLATAKLENTVGLNGNTPEYLEINKDDCFLAGEIEKRSYALKQTINIKPEENLFFGCTVISHFKKQIKLTPTLNTYENSIYSSSLNKDEKLEEFTIEPGEKKRISLKLEKQKIPQLYEAKMDFFQTDSAVAIVAPVIFHYTVTGESATIQKLDIDKSSYQKGDNMNVNLIWSGSATKVFLSVDVFNQENKKCIDTLTQTLNPNAKRFKLALLTKIDCINPMVKISLKNEKGAILTQKEFNFSKDNKTLPQKLEPSSNKNIINLALVLLLIIIAGGTFWLWKKKKIIYTSVLFLIMFVLLGIGVQKTEAATWYGYRDGNYLTASLTDASTLYNPGETIHGSITVKYAGVWDNDRGDTSLFINVCGTGVGRPDDGKENKYNFTCNASDSIGDNDIKIEFTLSDQFTQTPAVENKRIDYPLPYTTITEKPTVKNISFDKKEYAIGDKQYLKWETADATSGKLFCVDLFGTNDTFRDDNVSANSAGYDLGAVSSYMKGKCAITAYYKDKPGRTGYAGANVKAPSPEAGVCGNGKREGLEECDGIDGITPKPDPDIYGGIKNSDNCQLSRCSSSCKLNHCIGLDGICGSINTKSSCSIPTASELCSSGRMSGFYQGTTSFRWTCSPDSYFQPVAQWVIATASSESCYAARSCTTSCTPAVAGSEYLQFSGNWVYTTGCLQSQPADSQRWSDSIKECCGVGVVYYCAENYFWNKSSLNCESVKPPLPDTCGLSCLASTACDYPLSCIDDKFILNPTNPEMINWMTDTGSNGNGIFGAVLSPYTQYFHPAKYRSFHGKCRNKDYPLSGDCVSPMHGEVCTTINAIYPSLLSGSYGGQVFLFKSPKDCYNTNWPGTQGYLDCYDPNGDGVGRCCLEDDTDAECQDTTSPTPTPT
ncbi:MAG: hypothetical protein WCK16_05340, partial [Candidatus Moraniibacteriota bacterium]